MFRKAELASTKEGKSVVSLLFSSVLLNCETLPFSDIPRETICWGLLVFGRSVLKGSMMFCFLR